MKIEELNGINKKYDGALAIKDLFLEVRKSEVLSIIGPNG